MINDSIPTIIAFLNKRYGKISDPQLVEKERELLEFTWDIDEQPDTAFNEVDNFADHNLVELMTYFNATLEEAGNSVILAIVGL